LYPGPAYEKGIGSYSSGLSPDMTKQTKQSTVDRRFSSQAGKIADPNSAKEAFTDIL
jgi:hypothetical protein